MGRDAIPAGMVEWRGGNAAPVDWDGGALLFRDGIKVQGQNASGLASLVNPSAWAHHDCVGDIIAYTPKPDAKLSLVRVDFVPAKPDDGDRDAAVVEAMARAIFAYDEHWATLMGNQWDYAPSIQHKKCTNQARAALAAYRTHQEAF